MFIFQPFSRTSRWNFSNLFRGTAIKMSAFESTESKHKSNGVLDVFPPESPSAEICPDFVMKYKNIPFRTYHLLVLMMNRQDANDVWLFFLQSIWYLYENKRSMEVLHEVIKSIWFECHEKVRKNTILFNFSPISINIEVKSIFFIYYLRFGFLCWWLVQNRCAHWLSGRSLSIPFRRCHVRISAAFH